MDENYLCINCRYCFEFFSLFCYKTGRECPSVCAKCENYKEHYSSSDVLKLITKEEKK